MKQITLAVPTTLPGALATTMPCEGPHIVTDADAAYLQGEGVLADDPVDAPDDPLREPVEANIGDETAPAHRRRRGSAD